MITVAAAILEREGKILIAKRKKDDPLKGKWEFPGGKVEPNETPQECLIRELEEELGIKAKIKNFVCSSQYKYPHLSINLLVYTAEYISGELHAKEHEEIKWVKPEDLKLYDFPAADKPIIEKILAFIHD